MVGLARRANFRDNPVYSVRRYQRSEKSAEMTKISVGEFI